MIKMGKTFRRNSDDSKWGKESRKGNKRVRGEKKRRDTEDIYYEEYKQYENRRNIPIATSSINHDDRRT